jgi:hypothetical protein
MTTAPVFRHLAALPEGEVRDLAAVRALDELPGAEGALLLETALDLARAGTPAESAAAWSVCRAVLPEAGLPYERRQEIYESAREGGLLAAALLLAPPPLREAPDPRAPKGDLSLGHRRTLARTAASGRFDRLGAEEDARVAVELLKNPRLTEREVLRLASRRPAQVEVLTAIAHSPRWITRPAVKSALARNPYAPPGLVLRFLPHLPAPILTAIAGDATLHPELRRFARALLGR